MNQTIDSVLRVVEQQKSYSSKVRMIQNQIAKYQNVDYENTLVLARYGLELANQQRDKKNQGEFTRNIGFVYAKKGVIDSASVYYFEALAILEKSEFHSELGMLYDDMARMYRKLKDSKKAISFYDKALALYAKHKDLEGIARINNESGIVFQDMGDLDEAHHRFTKSLEIQLKRKDSIGISYAYEFLGQNAALKNKLDLAKAYFEDALEIRKKLGDQFAIMLSYTSLGEVYKQLKQYDLSNEYFKKSNALAKKIDLLDIQAYNFSKLQDNYANLNDYKNAYKFLKENNIIQDSLYNIDKLKAVEEISTKYQTAENERIILEQRAKLAEGRVYILGLIFLLVVFGILIYFYVLKQRLKHQQFKKEAELNEAKIKLEATKKLQDERLRISRDLHDNIGAQLAFIISAIDNLSYGLQGKEERIQHKLTSIKEFVSGTIGELRDTIWAMNLTSVSFAELKSHTVNFVNSARQFHDEVVIEMNFNEIEDNVMFTNLQGLNIFRILQEAINNALKYAEASKISISANQKGNQLLFTITDNGKGFTISEVELGNGLNNMQKRGMDLKANLQINSQLQQGTIIQFEITL